MHKRPSSVSTAIARSGHSFSAALAFIEENATNTRSKTSQDFIVPANNRNQSISDDVVIKYLSPRSTLKKLRHYFLTDLEPLAN